MSNKRYDLVGYTLSTYEKDGQQKRRTINIGSMMEGVSKDGKPYRFLTLSKHINLAGLFSEENKDTTVVQIYEATQNQENQQPQSGARGAQSSSSAVPNAVREDDEIPF